MLIDLIKNRYSLRNFSSKVPAFEDIRDILEAGRLAPSFLNLQPWHFIVIKDENTKNMVARLLSFEFFSRFGINEGNKAFEVWITTDRTQKTPAEKLTEFSGKLMPKTESDVFYLFVRMKTDADNDFQGEEYSGIGITVYAVQGNVNM